MTGQAPGFRRWHQALKQHCERFLGPSPHGLGEIVPSSEFALTLFPHPPTSDRQWLTIRTAGVSDYPMAAPSGEEDRAYCELLTYMPPDWELQGSDGGWWPAAMLKRLGQFVHENETWFGDRHTVVLSEPGETYAPGTLFSGVLLRLPTAEPDEFDELTIEGIRCRFLWAFPITEAETELKLEQGTEALLALIDHQLDHVTDPRRPCLVTGRQP